MMFYETVGWSGLKHTLSEEENPFIYSKYFSALIDNRTVYSVTQDLFQNTIGKYLLELFQNLKVLMLLTFDISYKD